MTRGRITVILDNEIIWTSTEFNGGMCHSDGGYGKEIMSALERVTTLDEYKKYVESFNKNHHDYDDDPLTYELTDMREVTNEEYIFTYEEFLDMRKDYFNKWFSDYLYIKNLSSETVSFIDRKGNVYDLKSMNVAVFNYGWYDNKVPNNGLMFNQEETENILNELLENYFDELDWNFQIYTYSNEHSIYLSKRSPAGEDFGFEIQAGTVDEIIEEICEYANDFDADEHCMMWIRDRGTRGIPCSIRELIDDAESIQDMLDELVDKVRELSRE